MLKILLIINMSMAKNIIGIISFPFMMLGQNLKSRGVILRLGQFNLMGLVSFSILVLFIYEFELFNIGSTYGLRWST